MTDPVALYDMPLGIEGKLYVGAAGATPTDVLGDEQKFEYSLENTTPEWNTRGKPLGTSGYAGQKITASTSVIKNNLNDSFIALKIAARTRIPIAIKSIDRTGGYGIDADWTVKSAKESQDKEGNATVDFEFTLNQLYRAPTWIDPV